MTRVHTRNLSAMALLTRAAALILCLHTAWAAGGGSPCVARHYGFSSFVCVCNASYCDEPAPAPPPRPGRIAHYASSRSGLRLALSTANFTETAALPDGAARLLVDTSQQFQKMLGFGASMTDSSAINIAALSKEAQEKLLKSYFGNGEGSARYSMVRLPIGGTDFSTRNYTYDDGAADPKLKNFALATEDVDYKIPLLQRAQQLAGSQLKLHAVPWSAPSWMKEGNGTAGFSSLQLRYYQVWANYFVRFLEEYARRGLRIWAVSLQNEPTDGTLVSYGINSMGWGPATMRRFLEKALGPTLRRNPQFASTRFIIGEDQRSYIDWSIEMLKGRITRELTSVVSLHWYLDRSSSPEALDRLHDLHPDKFILYTEACDGPFLSGELPAVQLGSWERAENYSSDITQTTNHWSSGWHDWNLALDAEGGPNWAGNVVDASVIVNATSGEFYKQPMYYAIAHYSRFVPPGSRRVALLTDAGTTDVESAAFLRPGGDVVVVLQNRQESARQLVLRDPSLGDAELSLPAHSIHTLVYPRAGGHAHGYGR